jgi:hypothetical protein
VSAVATPPQINDPEQALFDQIAEFRWDPLGCVLYSFDWGHGELELETGPRKFQCEFLSELGTHLQNPATRHTPFRKAVSSGHGIGKSALIGQIVHWAKSTCVDCKVIVTANTGDQLKTKTQPEMAKWFRLSINSSWFEVNVQAIKICDAEHEQTWRTDFATWSEENPQAFAGAHNYGKRLVIIFDEAGGISDAIYRVVEGALTDKNTEIIWIAFSQCIRSEGGFYESVFGNQRHRWRPMVIDSREVEGVNVQEINESIAIYGEDSDHVRVRYRGLYPQAGGGQFIDAKRIEDAQRRPVRPMSDDPLTAGVDFAWGGSDDNVVRFRRGLDGRTIPPIKVKGEFTRDPAVMRDRLVNVLNTWYECSDGIRRKVDMLFFDSAGIAAPVEAGLKALGFENRITVVNFGADSPKPHCVFFRDYMWEEMKQWLLKGGIDAEPSFAADLKKPIIVSDPKQRIKLESKDVMKKRLAKLGLDSTSPDDGDAFALTFAHPVVRKKANEQAPPPPSRDDGLGWMG